MLEGSRRSSKGSPFDVEGRTTEKVPDTLSNRSQGNTLLDKANLKPTIF